MINKNVHTLEFIYCNLTLWSLVATLAAASNNAIPTKVQ